MAINRVFADRRGEKLSFLIAGARFFVDSAAFRKMYLKEWKKDGIIQAELLSQFGQGRRMQT